MLRPLIARRVKKADEFPGNGIDSRKVWPFMCIASIARESKILDRRFAAMLPGDDMIDLKSQLGKTFREVTVLATERSTFANSAPKQRMHPRSGSHPLQREARLRLEELQCGRDSSVILQFALLCSRELASRRF